jgi:hypothetical protein
MIITRSWTLVMPSRFASRARRTPIVRRFASHDIGIRGREVPFAVVQEDPYVARSRLVIHERRDEIRAVDPVEIRDLHVSCGAAARGMKEGAGQRFLREAETVIASRNR